MPEVSLTHLAKFGGIEPAHKALPVKDKDQPTTNRTKV